jgi:hypothetical protein
LPGYRAHFLLHRGARGSLDGGIVVSAQSERSNDRSDEQREGKCFENLHDV